jgi:hypothetical protein
MPNHKLSELDIILAAVANGKLSIAEASRWAIFDGTPYQMVEHLDVGTKFHALITKPTGRKFLEFTVVQVDPEEKVVVAKDQEGDEIEITPDTSSDELDEIITPEITEEEPADMTIDSDAYDDELDDIINAEAEKIGKTVSDTDIVDVNPDSMLTVNPRAKDTDDEENLDITELDNNRDSFSTKTDVDPVESLYRRKYSESSLSKNYPMSERLLRRMSDSDLAMDDDYDESLYTNPDDNEIVSDDLEPLSPEDKITAKERALKEKYRKLSSALRRYSEAVEDDNPNLDDLNAVQDPNVNIAVGDTVMNLTTGNSGIVTSTSFNEDGEMTVTFIRDNGQSETCRASECQKLS